MKNKITKEMMNRGMKFVAFIPTEFFRFNHSKVSVLDDRVGRLGKLRNINFGIERIMEPIAEVAITGCLVHLRNGTHVHIHFVILTNCAYLQKKCMSSVKYVSKENESCPKCHVERDRVEEHIQNLKTGRCTKQ